MVPSFEFRNSPMIKAVLYKRKSNPFLKESPPPTHVIHSRGNQTSRAEVTFVPFITPEVLSFMEGENVHISTKYLCFVRIKYL
jgi:hypothetical protein